MPDASFSLRRMLGERALWILATLVLLFFLRPLLGETFYFRDIYLLFYGKKVLWAEAVRQGQVPLWDPLMHGGQPFLASPGTSALYPFNLLFLILPPLTAFNLLLVLQFLCCSVSAYFLARAVALPPISAFVCGAVYTFCGYVLSSSSLLVLMQALPWAPALVASIHLLVSEERKRWLIASALFTALPILGGGADMSAMALALAAAWAVLVPCSTPLRRRLRLALAAIGLGIGLTLVLTVPAYEVIRNSSRSAKRDYATFVQWSVSPQRLPELIVPRFFGPTDTLARRDYWGGKFEYGYPYMISIYFGTSVFVLAFAGLAAGSIPGRARGLLGVSALAGLVLCLGGNLSFFPFLWEHVPLIGIFRFPVKALQLTLVPLALLSAAGVGASIGRARHLATVAAIVSAVGLFAAIGLQPSLERAILGFKLPPASSAELVQSLLHASLAAALLVAALLWKRPLALAALVVIDLGLAGWRVNPYASRELFVTPPLAARVRSLLGEGRLYRTPDPYVQKLIVPSNEGVWLAWWDLQLLSRYTAATFGIPLVFHEDYDGLAPIRMARMTERIARMPWPERLGVLSMAGATVIITPDRIQAPTIDRVETLRGANGLPLYLYRNRAATPLRFNGCQASMRTLHRSMNQWSVDVASPCRGTLIFAESWYPGWRMSVDGRRQPQLLAEFGLSAVAVPAGRHLVSRNYRPVLPLAGLLGSVGAALMLVFWRVPQ